MGLIDRMVQRLEQQKGLDPPSEALQKAVAATFRVTGKKLKDSLHGTWLGHPLHPVLTDVPIGAWTVALVLDALDLVGVTGLRPGADAAIVVGLVGGVAAAVTGLTEWQHTESSPRRVGLVHGLLNLTAIALYGGSLALRRNGTWVTGQVVSFLGYGLLSAAGYLGGHLAYGQRIGMNQAAPPPEEHAPREFVSVLRASELQEGQLRRVDADGGPLLLTRQDDRVYGLADTCAHLGCSLAKGTLERGSIVCKCHGSRFALEDGRVLEGPSTFPQPHFETRIRNGAIEVRSTVA